MSSLKLENDRMILETDNPAGQMHSLYDKKTGRELLYQADQGWSGRNPTLFPVVGKTWKGGEYEWNNVSYTLKNHGLIRYEDLTGKVEDNAIVYTFDSNEETKARYPFDFHFEMRYSLLENGVHVSYAITNTGAENMPFSFGLHPAFRTVQNDDESFDSFSIRFEPAAPAEQIVFFPDLSPVRREPVELDTWKLSIPDIEEYATLIYDKIEAQSATLLYKDEPRMKMSFAGFPMVALWNAGKGNDFICIEPWFGHTDLEKTDAAFDQREGTMILKPAENFNASYFIESLG